MKARSVVWVALAMALALGPPGRADEPVVAGQDNVPAPKKTKTVLPEYPPEAQARGQRGIVIVELIIDTQGKVSSAQIVRSIPPFDEAALTAVRQWEYEVTKVNGKAVSVKLTVPITFAMKIPEIGSRQEGIPELRAGAFPPLPVDARETATATAEVTLGAEGNVEELRIVDGPPAYADSLARALRTWRFSPDPSEATVTFQVHAQFNPSAKGTTPRVEFRLDGLRRSESVATADSGAAAPGTAATPSSPTPPAAVAPPPEPPPTAPAAAPVTAMPSPTATLPAPASPPPAVVASPTSKREPEKATPTPAAAPPAAKPAATPPTATPTATPAAAQPTATQPTATATPATTTPPMSSTTKPGAQPAPAVATAAPTVAPPALPAAASYPAPASSPASQGPASAEAKASNPPAPGGPSAPRPTPAPASAPKAPAVEVLSVPPPAEPPENGLSAVRDVTLTPGVPDLTRGRRPMPPPFARMAQATGRVDVSFSVDAAGIASVKGSTGPEVFKRAAEQAVSSWTFRRTRAERIFLVAEFKYATDAASATVRPDVK
jgi:TonB family protein